MDASSTELPSLESKYAGMRGTFGSALRTGTHRASMPPCAGEPPWGASLLISLGTPMSQSLAQLAERCRRLARGRVLAYGSDDVHITVRSLEGFRGTPLNQARRDELCAYVEASLVGASPFTLGMNGLAGGGDTVFACGYPSPELAQLRNTLHRHRDLIGGTGPVSPDASRVRDTAHASLMVFRDQAIAEPEVAALLDDLREADLGDECVKELVLAEFSPTISGAGMHRLCTFTLGKPWSRPSS